MIKQKRAAMEMSVGTIVTIVLLMAVLILGLVLVRTIFTGATENIEAIDESIKSEINKLFVGDTSKKIVIFPASRIIVLKKGGDPAGFAFSVRNNDVDNRDFTYTIEADRSFDFRKCGSGFNAIQADSWLLFSSGSFTIDRGSSLEIPELVLFEIPDSAPPCTIPYRLDITWKVTENYVGTKIFVTIK